jgi:hypothetical protein
VDTSHPMESTMRIKEENLELIEKGEGYPLCIHLVR